MVSTITCPRCKKVTTRHGMIKVVSSNVRYYCPECAKAHEKKISNAIQKQKNKEAEESREGKTAARDARELAELVDYICVLYDTSKPNMVALKQVKDYKEEYGFRYAGMELALKYFYELQDNSTERSHGVGIIPYVYEDAREHAIKKIQIKKNAKGMETERVSFKEGRNTKRKKRIGIDLNELGVDEG